MKEITIRTVNGGYAVSYVGVSKRDDKEPYVYKNTEEHKLLEEIGEAVCEYKIKVERR